LKNRFRILDNKPFHTYRTQVKLVLACCILHNWILGYGDDEHVPDEATWNPKHRNVDAHPDDVPDNQAWSQMREAWANAMWANRGSSR
jgi:hypothetical protein